MSAASSAPLTDTKNNKSNATTVVSVDQMQLANWEGSIPVVVSLAPTSLSSPTAPPPIHLLLGRQTYLHLGLLSAVRRLHPFAPTTFSFFRSGAGGAAVVRNEPEPGQEELDDQTTNVAPIRTPSKQQQQQEYETEEYDCPVCWFEDEESQLPLRWHLFAGVLYDMVQCHTRNNNNHQTWLPWRLRLHFTNYPNSVLLPLSAKQVERQIRAILQNSLKQAITLRTGQSKAALQLMTKETHQMLWQALQQHDSSSGGGGRRYYSLYYKQVASDLNAKLGIGDAASSKSHTNARIPVRLLLGPTHAGSIQKSCLATRELTLKQLLVKWLPPKYIVPDSDSVVDGLVCKVQGIEPPLDAAVLELWQYLCHPDYFLYIVVHIIQTVE